MDKNIKEPVRISDQEKLLETESGMFLLEIERISPEIEAYIETSYVSTEIKDKCRKIIVNLSEKIKEEIELENRTRYTILHPYDLARNAISELLNLLGNQDKEQSSLFEVLRNLILEARNSSVGWKNK